MRFAGNAKPPSILSQMIAEAHEIREKQSAHRAHVITNVAMKSQNQAEDSVGQISMKLIYTQTICV